jgi:hypothetical protein
MMTFASAHPHRILEALAEERSAFTRLPEATWAIIQDKLGTAHLAVTQELEPSIQSHGFLLGVSELPTTEVSLWQVKPPASSTSAPSKEITAQLCLGSTFARPQAIYLIPAQRVWQALRLADVSVPLLEAVPNLCLNPLAMSGWLHISTDTEVFTLQLASALGRVVRQHQHYPFVLDAYGLTRRDLPDAVYLVELGQSHAFSLEDVNLDVLVQHWLTGLPGALQEEGWKQWASCLSSRTHAFTTLSDLEQVIQSQGCGILLRQLQAFRQSHLFCETPAQKPFQLAAALKHAEQENRLLVVDISRVPPQYHDMTWMLLSYGLGRIPLPPDRFFIMPFLRHLSSGSNPPWQALVSQGLRVATFCPAASPVINRDTTYSDAVPDGIIHIHTLQQSLFMQGPFTLQLPIHVPFGQAGITTGTHVLPSSTTLPIVHLDAPGSATTEPDSVNAQPEQWTAPAVTSPDFHANVSSATEDVPEDQSLAISNNTVNDADQFLKEQLLLDDPRGFNNHTRAVPYTPDNVPEHLKAYGSLNPYRSSQLNAGEGFHVPEALPHQENTPQAFVKNTEFVEEYASEQHPPSMAPTYSDEVIAQWQPYETSSSYVDVSAEQDFLMSFDDESSTVHSSSITTTAYPANADFSEEAPEPASTDGLWLQPSSISHMAVPSDAYTSNQQDETDVREFPETDIYPATATESHSDEEGVFYSSILGQMPEEWRRLIERELLQGNTATEVTPQFFSETPRFSYVQDAAALQSDEDQEGTIEHIHPCLPETLIDEVKAFMPDDTSDNDAAEAARASMARETEHLEDVNAPSKPTELTKQQVDMAPEPDEEDTFGPLLQSEYLADTRSRSLFDDILSSSESTDASVPVSEDDPDVFGSHFDPYYFPLNATSAQHPEPSSSESYQNWPRTTEDADQLGQPIDSRHLVEPVAISPSMQVLHQDPSGTQPLQEMGSASYPDEPAPVWESGAVEPDEIRPAHFSQGVMPETIHEPVIDVTADYHDVPFSAPPLAVDLKAHSATISGIPDDMDLSGMDFDLDLIAEPHSTTASPVPGLPHVDVDSLRAQHGLPIHSETSAPLQEPSEQGFSADEQALQQEAEAFIQSIPSDPSAFHGEGASSDIPAFEFPPEPDTPSGSGLEHPHTGFANVFGTDDFAPHLPELPEPPSAVTNSQEDSPQHSIHTPQMSPASSPVEPERLITPPAVEDAVPTSHTPIYQAEIPTEQEEVPATEPGFEAGQRVTHGLYGTGVIQNVVDIEGRTVLSILFDEAGKRLLDPSLSEVTHV